MVPLFSRAARLLAVVAVLSACSGSQADEVPTSMGSDLGPVETVSELMRAVFDGRFEDAALLTDSEQAVLVALAEGAEAGELVDALESDPTVVASNFWSGYAQTMEGDATIEGLTFDEGDTVTEGDLTYATVVVEDPSGNQQLFYLRREEGWTVDLMATFGPVLAERMIPRVEALLSSANANAGVLIGLLRDSVASLQVAIRRPEIDLATHQTLLALIERVTRAS